jgi:hypothetical protein
MSSVSFIVASRGHHPARRATAPIATVALTIGLLLSAADTADAQATRPAPRHSWELLASSGALVPTGAQREALKDAALSTAQVSYVVRSRLAVTTTAGWARSRDRVTEGDPKLSVFTYDVGVEARAPRSPGSAGLTFTPFAGVGAGGRSYNHRTLDRDARHGLAGYAAAGGEFGAGRVRLRLEARDYVTGIKPLAGARGSAARNDVVVLAGLRFARQRPR